MFSPGFSKDQMHSYPLKDDWMCLEANHQKLKFNYRYNHYLDCMIEFEVFEGDRCIGKGVQHTMKPQEWLDSFVFGGMFNVWIKERRVKVIN